MKRYPLNPHHRHPHRADSQNGEAKLHERASGKGNVNAMPEREDLLALSQMITRSRARRRHFLPGELFAEPAWEMLLALYRANAEGHRMTVSNMCHASDGPETTALRWIEKLAELGMVTKRKNPLDARMVFIELEPNARDRIQDYLMETWVSIFAPD